MAGVIVVIVVLTYVSAPTQRRSETAMGPQLKDWRVMSVSILDHSLNLILWSAKLLADAIGCCVLHLCRWLTTGTSGKRVMSQNVVTPSSQRAKLISDKISVEMFKFILPLFQK